MGIIFDAQLKFVDHINNKINKAYQILGIIKRNFYIFKTTQFSHIIQIFCYVRIWNMESSVWSLHHEYLIEIFFRKSAKQNYLHQTFETRRRLRHLKLPTLKF